MAFSVQTEGRGVSDRLDIRLHSITGENTYLLFVRFARSIVHKIRLCGRFFGGGRRAERSGLEPIGRATVQMLVQFGLEQILHLVHLTFRALRQIVRHNGRTEIRGRLLHRCRSGEDERSLFVCSVCANWLTGRLRRAGDGAAAWSGLRDFTRADYGWLRTSV